MNLRHKPVSEIMRREVVTIAPKEKLDLSQDLMNLGRVRHLPVLEGGRVVGIISHRDLLAASMTKALDFDAVSRRTFLRSVEVEEVMARDIVTVGPETTLADAARILVRRQIGCLPVVGPDQSLIGMITETDLLAEAFLDGWKPEESEVIDVSTSASFSEWIQGEVRDLRRMRDELRVQGHLAKAEVRDRWEVLERTLESLELRAKRATRAAEQPLHQLETDVRKVASDLREGYRRIRDAL